MVLRCPEPDRDTPVAFAAVSADRERLQHWLPWVPAIDTEEAERTFLEKVVRWWDEDAQFHWLMFDKETFAYIGIIGPHRVEWAHGTVELGYWLVADFEGEGRMSEAVTAVEKTLFAMGFHRIEIRCSANNARSAAIPNRLGYTLDGTLRENRVEHGQRTDTQIWAKLRSV
ncbi:MAG: GNAT family N-acetyltransferase [Myxococcales bacterium]|nr:GNAT family N-acetyltransferase [Myxococcales bacterium]